MNEEALQYGYNLFKNDGYNGTLEEYKALISSNKEALDYSYTLFKNDGYKDSIDDFESLLGLKKKEDTASTSLDGSLEPFQINDDQLYAANKAALSAIGVPSSFGGFLSNALTRGISRGAATDETLKVMYGGKDVTDDDIQKFIKVNQIADSMGQSEAMMEFNKGYEEDVNAGSSEVWAFIKNIAKTPAAAAEVAITSLSQMASGALSSKEGFGIVAAGAGTGAGIGFGLGLAGGPLAPATSTVGAITGSIKGAMSAAGALTETTSSFVEFLKEELKDKAFTQENIRAILDDEEAKQRIINRSLARGATIATIDFLAAGASGVAAKSIKTVGRTGKVARGLATTSIEAAGGAGGEIAGRLAAGQEIDTREILFEAIGEVPGAAVSGPLGLMSAPKYKVNKGALSKNDFLKIVNTATDEEILSMDITIDNDEAMADIYNAKVNRAKTKKNIDPTITEQEDIDAVVDREIEIKELKKKDSYSAKNRVKELEAEIKQIQEKYKVAQQEEVVAAEPATQASTAPKVSDVINRPVVLTELGGAPLDTPIQGDMFVEGQQVVVEDADGNITEVGNVDEISDTPIDQLGIQYTEAQVTANADGTLGIDNKNYTIQEDLPTQGLVFDKDGNVIEASVKDETGKPVMFKGPIAEDIAYQILLKDTTSPQQAEIINQLLEQDDEFRKATAAAQVAADQNINEIEGTSEILAKPIASEQEVIQSEQEINAEVEKLSSILGATNLSKQIGNSVKALSRIATGVKFVVYDSEEQYIKATGDNSSGSYDPNSKVISINASKASPTTVAHEAFHAILTNLVKTDAEAKVLTERMMKAVSRNAPAELKIYIDEFAADYENNIQSEEKLAELVGVLASEYTTLPTNTQNIVKRWLDKIAKMIGVKPFTDAEVIDVLNTISKKISTGEEIAFEDVNVLGDPNTIGEKMSKRFQSNFTDKVSGLTFVYDANTEKFNKLEEDGFITKDRSLSDFDGEVILLHQPDAAFSGTIMKNGEILVEGKGGVFYPIKFHEDGYFWASTARGAEKMANDLNKVYEENNGKILMALTSAPYNKLLSSTTMSNAVLDFFVSKAVDRRFKITKKNVMDAVASAASKTIVVKNKKKGLGLTIDKSKGLDSMLSEIKQKLSADNSTFADRKTFVDTLISEMSDIINSNEVSTKQFGEVFSKGIQNKYFKGVTKTGKLKVSTANMTQAISEMLTEPMLKEGVERKTGGQVYAILEINGPVEAVDSDKHESYPKAIRSVEGQKTVVHILKDRQNWNKNFEDFQTGDLVSKDREMQVFPSSIGISVKGLRLKARRQADSVVSIIRKAKINGVSDSAVLKYLADNNLDVNKGAEILDRINKEETRSKQKAEGLFDPERNQVYNFLDEIHRVAMSGRGYKPISMQIQSEYLNGAIEAEIRIAIKNVRKIQRSIGKFKDRKAVIESIDKFMRGDKDHNVPQSILGVVSDMRTHLDNLSRKLADSGIVSDTKFDDLPKSERKSLIKKYGGDEQLARQNYRSSKQNILENLGSYLNRSYEVYDNKNYAKKVTDEVKQAAKNKLKEMHRKYAEAESLETGIPVEIILNKKVDSIIDGILNQDEGNEFVMRSKEGSKNLTPLEQRKDIPAEIRALMGEYGDPSMNYVRSIQKVASIIANQNFQNELRKAGEGVYLFKEPTGIYNTKIAGDSSKSMDILAGMYTTKEIAEAMSRGSVFDIDLGKAQWIYNFWLKGVGAIKYSKTILSVGTHAKNIIGNIPLMLMNGNFNFSAFNEAIQVLRAEYSENGNSALLAKMDEYVRAGIISQGAEINEIRSLLSSGKTFEDLMIDKMSGPKYARAYKYTTRKVGSALKAFEKAYQVEDDFFKIASYESEKSKYAKYVFKKNINELTESELKEVKERAANVVKDTMPNYSRIGGYVKFLKAVPAAGTFVSFISESIRTSYNTIDLAFKEISDPKTTAIGIQRLSGIMSLAAVKAGIEVMFGLSSDGEEEDELIKSARKFLPFFDVNSRIVPTEIKDGKLKYRSISASDPHGYMTKVFNAYMNADGYREGLIAAISEAAEPFTSPDLLLSAVLELKNNEDRYGRPIFKEGDTSEEIVIKIWGKVWSTIEPGTIKSIGKIYKSEDWVNEMIGQFSGFKENSVDVVEVVGYKTSDLYERAREAASDFTKAKKEYEAGEITLQELNARYIPANEKRKAVYMEAIDLYKGALYLGANPADVQQKMLDWRMPTDVLIGVMIGEIPDLKY